MEPDQDEHDEVKPTPSMACDHDWTLRWNHQATQRTVEDCTKCGARRFKDGVNYTLGETPPWVAEDHRRAYENARKTKE
jgi:hypothetical protein